MARDVDLLPALVEHLNREGFMASSFRGLASGLEISPGHLHYHFKNKEAVLTAVFDGIVLETEALFERSTQPAALPGQWLALQQKYAFFFRELPALLLEYPAIRRRYRAIREQRVLQCAALLGALAGAGLVAPEPEPEFFAKYAELLWHQCNSVLAFSRAESNVDAEQHAATMLRVLLFPILTDAGRGLLRNLGLGA